MLTSPDGLLVCLIGSFREAKVKRLICGLVLLLVAAGAFAAAPVVRLKICYIRMISNDLKLGR